MKTLTEIMEYLKERGFSNDFQIKNDIIVSKDTNEKFSPKDLIIENVYRYEGDSNPDDSAVLYAITARSGTRGILIDSYGAYADPKISALISEIPFREEHEYQDR
jgi:hypothetical protein